MSKELEVQSSTALALAPDQIAFTPVQRAALEHIGVDKAGPGDLEVFFHVVKRTGLDPFARQIYMIERAGKQTIQTGIDGYRLIGRRAANAAKSTVSVKAPQWAHPEGGWRDVWAKDWGNPLAARVTITRSGEEFTAVALFDEYVPRTRGGEVTSMWRQRPAGQLAKCAEALAWRMAFPQDLSGIYVDEELQHADARPAAAVERSTSTAKDAVRAAVAPGPVTDDPPEDAPPPAAKKGGMTKKMAGLYHKAFNDAGKTDRAERLAYTSKVIGRKIESSNELTKAEGSLVIDSLVAGDGEGEPPPDIDVEPVEEGTGPTADDELRDAIVASAEALGRDLPQVEAAFEHKYGGLSFWLGDHDQLTAFHTWVKKQKPVEA